MSLKLRGLLGFRHGHLAIVRLTLLFGILSVYAHLGEVASIRACVSPAARSDWMTFSNSTI